MSDNECECRCCDWAEYQAPVRTALAAAEERVTALETQLNNVYQQLCNMREAQLQLPESPNQRCGYCGLAKTPEGHDGCLGTLPGDVMNACCGHGRPNEAYIQFWDGSRIADVHELMAELTALRVENNRRKR